MGNIRTPQQKRSEETRKRIIAAAERLFSEKGYYNTNSKEIAKAANVSIGSFYSYFKDKKAGVSYKRDEVEMNITLLELNR